jgi:DNA-directed RNA polymerase specialized sigma24 family protein
VEVTSLQEKSQTLTAEQLLDLDDRLQKLGREDPQVAELVRLRVFAGLSVTEAAKVIKVSRTTGYEYWDFALAWFAADMQV